MLMFVCLAGTTGAAAQDTAGVGVIRGTVLGADAKPAADVAACIPALARCEVSDSEGRFVLNDLRRGTYDLEIAPPASPPLPARVEVRAGRDAVVEVTLPASEVVNETVVVTAPQFVAAEELNTSAFLIAADSVIQGAGALQDVSRYVQSLPGAVIGTDDFRNDLIVRGGSPLENLYIIDNVEIPNINTFANFASAGGTVSMLDAQLLRDVTFLTGAYPAPYGNRTSSVLQISLREGRTDRAGGRATLGFAGAGGVLEGPLPGRRGSWIVSLRRSFLDLFTNDTGIGGVPVLYTLNGKATYDLSPRDRIWLVNVSAVDRIRLGLSEDSDLSEELSTLDIRYRGNRAATGFNWQRTFGGRGVGLFSASYSRAQVRSSVADLIRDGIPPEGTSVAEQIAAGAPVFAEDSREQDLAIKYDLTSYVPVIGKVQSGVSVKRSEINYDVASPFGTDSPFFAVADQNPFRLALADVSYLTSAYVQGTRGIGTRATLTAGARLDRFGFLDVTRIAPRLGATFNLTRTLSLRTGAGRYFQQPFALFVAAFPTATPVVPFRADHIVGGITWKPSATASLTAEAYHKRYSEYPVSSQIAALSLANIGDTFNVRDVLFPIESSGIGRSTGVEFSAERRAESGARWYGQANLAFSRARHAGNDGVLRAASFDYPVVANVDGAYRIDGRWTLSTRMTFLSGRPYTTIDQAASAIARRAIYDLTRVNSERAPAYFRLDLRIDRELRLGGNSAKIFAGAQNVTNRRNFAGFSWDRRGNVLRELEQLGVFPTLGLEWRF
jgi:hypothetical protein